MSDFSKFDPLQITHFAGKPIDKMDTRELRSAVRFLVAENRQMWVAGLMNLGVKSAQSRTLAANHHDQ